MTTKKTSTKKAAEGKADTEELGAFAYHLSEVLRIARTNPLISAGFYNELADALNNSVNEVLNHVAAFYESEAYIRLALDTYVAAKTKQQAEGGAE